MRSSNSATRRRPDPLLIVFVLEPGGTRRVYDWYRTRHAADAAVAKLAADGVRAYVAVGPTH